VRFSSGATLPSVRKAYPWDVFATFSVKLQQDRTESWKLQAEISGERIDLKRHAFENEVKAITRHKFGIKKNDVWCIQVILDV
jgi:SHS2 domain-containing protein